MKVKASQKTSNLRPQKWCEMLQFSKSKNYTPWMPSLQIYSDSSCVDPLAKSWLVMASGGFLYIRRPRRPLHTYRDGWRKPPRILCSIMYHILCGWRNSRWLRPQWQRNKALRPKFACVCVFVGSNFGVSCAIGCYPVQLKVAWLKSAWWRLRFLLR